MILTRYVTRELLPPLLAGTALFTAILSFGYFFVSSQWLKNVPPGLILQWIGAQVPDTLVKVLPMGVVLMVVVAFGRLATERELIAVQSGGISLGRVARPATVIAALVAVLAVWLSLWVAPRLNVEARGLYWDTLTGGGLTTLSGRTTDLGGGLTLYLGGYDSATRRMTGVRVQQWDKDNAELGTLVFARDGTFENNQLQLRDYAVYRVNFAAVRDLEAVSDDPSKLRSAIGDVFTAVNTPPNKDATLTLDTGLSRKETLARYADAIGADSEGWPQLITKLTAPGVKAADRQAARVDLNRKLALPIGNLVLVLAALPFALRYGRTLGTSLGIALLIAVAYYLLFFVGIAVANMLPALPELGVWLANLVFAALGLTLLRRA
ncbi:LptF/LptG family permease [Deinococcus maricopensis]|uniref:Permease YjgP/YjgQ family protein n=1 Tax=Deinococcus maricopensis (strain DSM 21211 / LMG 22137 / NRRL B-23946 / LB-34) TaxID=709986 RepID=E8UBS1_DEIML|nr:LptF/LptG family permease [Deinococcus maricopensis]ADV68510.1 permease YjgP/YjgQ family protein [Deinococcus maricopensis DSM 21211]